MESKTNKILIVGPNPPPVGGASVTLKSITDELNKNVLIQLKIITTTPSGHLRVCSLNENIERFCRIFSIIFKYSILLPSCDVVLVFANNLFFSTICIPLLFLAKIYKKRFFIKPIGGDLDLYFNEKLLPFRKLYLKFINYTDGMLYQTKHLHSYFRNMGCNNSHYLPGVRPTTDSTKPVFSKSKNIKAIYFSHISREKGSLILLEALKTLSNTHSIDISCDFFGPIYDDIRYEFFNLLEATPNSRYCGIAEAGTGSILISKYDVLVLPTYFACEGHPGAIIEAMQVGVPVISTFHRSIPELITDNENGLLIPKKDPDALINALKTIAIDHQLRKKLGISNFFRGKEFQSKYVVTRMIDILFS